MEAIEQSIPDSRDARYSAPLSNVVYEIGNCLALAESLAPLIEAAGVDEGEDAVERARRVAEVLAEKLAALAAKVDELELNGPPATDPD